MVVDPPMVSVCIPAYNCEKYIGKAIESVLSQTYTDFELIIVDDCSNDNTMDIIASYKNPKIKYFRNKKNLGFSGNWNRALFLASGRYFKLLPDDDVLDRECLRIQIEVFEKKAHPGITLVFCNRDLIGEKGEMLLKRRIWRKDGPVSGKDLLKKCIRSGTNLIGEPGGVLVPTDLAKICGGFKAGNEFLIDLDFYHRIIENGNAYALSSRLAYFRVHRGSYSVKMASKQWQAFSQFIDEKSTDGIYRIDYRDAIIGKIKSGIQAYKRLLFYLYYLR